MGDITLTNQSPVTVSQAKKYLRDQGFPADDWDLLKMHINGIVGLMLNLMGRDRFVHVAAVQQNEFYRGDGACELYLKNAPIQDLVTVTLNPHGTSPVVLTGPGTSLSNDDMYYDRELGLVVLKTQVFPQRPSSVNIVYEAGFVAGSSELDNLQMICLDGIAGKWQRWKNQRHGMSSETKGETSITYNASDFDDVTVKELKRYRRHLFA